MTDSEPDPDRSDSASPADQAAIPGVDPTGADSLQADSNKVESATEAEAVNETDQATTSTDLPASTDSPHELDSDDLTEEELHFIDDLPMADAEMEKTVGPEEITVRSVDHSSGQGDIPNAEVVEAMIIDENTPVPELPKAPPPMMKTGVTIEGVDHGKIGTPPVVDAKPPLSWQIKPESQLAKESISSVGGAVASVVLGVLALIGAVFTSFSAINALLGFALGIWGLRSPRKKMAGIGLILCVFGFLLPISLGSMSLRDYWRSTNEVDPIEEDIMDTSDGI